MKELFEKNRAKMTDDEKRQVWKAITDARKRPRRRRFWLPVPTALGAAALAIFLLVNYVDMDSGRKEAVHRLAGGAGRHPTDMIKAPGTEGLPEEKGSDSFGLPEVKGSNTCGLPEVTLDKGDKGAGNRDADKALVVTDEADESKDVDAPAAPVDAIAIKSAAPDEGVGSLPEVKSARSNTSRTFDAILETASDPEIGDQPVPEQVRESAPSTMVHKKDKAMQGTAPGEVVLSVDPKERGTVDDAVALKSEKNQRYVQAAPRRGPQIVPAVFVGSAVGSLKTIRMAEQTEREERDRQAKALAAHKAAQERAQWDERQRKEREESEQRFKMLNALDSDSLLAYYAGRVDSLRQVCEAGGQVERDRGFLAGMVWDGETGNPIPWADIVVEGTGKGAVVQANGTFRLPDIKPGAYTVLVQRIGYKPTKFHNQNIKWGRVTALSVGLTPSGERIETINICGEVDQIDVQSSSSSQKIEKDELRVRGINNITDELSAGRGVVVESEDGAHVRGGRTDDEKFNVAGKPATLGYSEQAIREGLSRAKREAPPIAYENRNWLNSVGGTDPVNGAAFDAMFFEHYGVNPFIDPLDDNLATFAVDVDNGSYTLTRSYLERGALPPKDAVRVEEFINAIPHNYKPPELPSDRFTVFDAPRGYPGEAFAIHLDAAPAPFGNDLVLMRVGLKGREIDERDRKPANLTFVIDVSGSMKRDNRLELVKRSLFLLLDRMTHEDRVAIVVYGSTASTVLPSTSLEDRRTIERAIASLTTGGSTNAEDGLIEAYWNAGRSWRHDAINRVILCSDGVANVGRTGADEILARIGRDAKRGIELTTVGFGMGNYNDVLMEKLADKGDGNYYYVDQIGEARRIFVENLTGTLQTIARQVKIQVEFDPDRVRRYRLIGYENRDVADEDFRNDTVDAGEIGAGHEVTALFEVRLENGVTRGDLATVRVRHEDPETGQVRERKEKIGIGDIGRSFSSADAMFRLDATVAEFAEILRHSYWAQGSDFSQVERLAEQAARDLGRNDAVDELVDLISRARILSAAEERDDGRRDPVRPKWSPERR